MTCGSHCLLLPNLQPPGWDLGGEKGGEEGNGGSVWLLLPARNTSMLTRSPSEGAGAGARVPSRSHSARTHGPHCPTATVTVCQDRGSCWEPQPCRSTVFAVTGSGCQGAHPLPLRHDWLPGSCLHPPGLGWSRGRGQLRAWQQGDEGTTGSSQPTGATVGAAQPLRIPHQNSRFPPTATTQQSEGLVLQDSWSF